MDFEGNTCTTNYHYKACNIYASISPSLSRYFVSKINDSLFKNEVHSKTKETFASKLTGHYCPQCGTRLSDGTKDSSVRIKPRKPPNKKTVKIIKGCNLYNNWNKLSSKARKDVLRYERRTNKLIIDCVICGQRSRTDCIKRKQPPSNKSLLATPVASVRTLLQTASPIGHKNRTPNSQSVVTPSSSSKKRSLKHKRHSSLQMMLDQNQEDKRRSQQSPLHGFLQSL
ncbi:uncharacterized protein [Antedon mediterranea]|uniref:uncharacterized protein n=1 Tax=Antedon mediterranea TaxID=105859 RepID=UPI003AF4192F